MSDQGIFTDPDKKQPEGSTDPAQNTNPFGDKLTKIVNEEGKPKYDSVETALDALAASQAHISKLESEAKARELKEQELTAKLQEMGNIDDFVKRLKPDAKPEDANPTEGGVQGLSEERVAEILEARLKEQASASSKQENLNKVLNALSTTYGDNAASVVLARATELGTTPSALQELAKENPDLVLAAVSGGQKAPKQAPAKATHKFGLKPNEDNPQPKFDRGITRGGISDKDMAERFKQSKEWTMKRLQS